MSTEKDHAEIAWKMRKTTLTLLQYLRSSFHGEKFCGISEKQLEVIRSLIAELQESGELL